MKLLPSFTGQPELNKVSRNCPVCGVEYLADKGRLKHGRQTTCSRECSYKYRAQKLTVEVTKQCVHCGKDITRSPYQFRYDGVFCGDECYQQYRADKAGYKTRMKAGYCATCGKRYKPVKRSNRYCSRECFEKAHKDHMRGENNPSFIDGRSYDKTYDVGADWHDIRRKVYKRDDYRCQSCGTKCVSKSVAMRYPSKSKRIIQCHHIDPYEVSGSNDLENLITLCISCHRRIHNVTA